MKRLIRLFLHKNGYKYIIILLNYPFFYHLLQTITLSLLVIKIYTFLAFKYLYYKYKLIIFKMNSSKKDNQTDEKTKTFN